MTSEAAGAKAARDTPTAVRGAATAFSDIAAVSGARAVSMALALLSVTLVTHLLAPAQYSILAYISVLAGLIQLAASSWTSTSVTRYGREELEHSGTIRTTSWSRFVIIAPMAALAVAVIVIAKLIGALPREIDWSYVTIILATAFMMLAAEHVLTLLEASGRMKLTAVGLAIQRVGSILGVVALIVFGLAHSPEHIALVWLTTGALFAVVLAKAVWRIGLWPPTLDKALFRRILRFSLPMVAFSVSQYIIQGVDIVILGIFRPSRDVGLYAVAYSGYGTLQQIVTTATIVLSPLFVSFRAAGQEDAIRRYAVRLVPQVLVLTAMAAGFAAPLLRVVIPIVFGARFAPSARPLSLLLLAWLLYAAGSYVAPILVLHERSRAMGMINLLAAAVNVVGDLLLVGVVGIGIEGPAIATVASLAVIALGYNMVAGDCIGERLRLPLAILAPGLCGVALSLVLGSVPAVVVGTSAVGVVTVGVLAWCRPFTAGDAEMIAKLDIPEAARRRLIALIAHFG